jgi:putative alpha-1,2-mannosidase
MTITRPGATIVLEARGNSRETPYIGKVKVNGRTWNHNFLRHEDLVKGARIRFRMSEKPVTGRGTRTEDRPYSFSEEGK